MAIDTLATGAFSDANENITVTSNTQTGNVLSNTTNATDALITGYSINGMKYKAGQTAAIYGLGVFKLEASGDYTLSVEGQRNANTEMPKVTYTVKNGSVTETSDLNVELGSGIEPKPYAEAKWPAGVYVDLDTNVTIANGQAGGNVLLGFLTEYRPYISGFRIGNAYFASNQTVNIENFGEVTVNRDGSYVIRADNLPEGAQVPVIALTVSNGTVASSSDIILSVSDNAVPSLTDADEQLTDVSGNVLSNAESVGGDRLGVTSIVVGNHAYNPGDLIQFDGGTLQIKSNGDYEFISNGGYASYISPQVTYTASNGIKTDTSVMSIMHDWSHLEGSFGIDIMDQGRVIFGNNNGTGETTLVGQPYDSDLLIGDGYTAAAVGNTIVAGSVMASSASDILVGDRLNINHLSWQNNGTTVKGSSYDNAANGLRDYLKSTGAAGSDAEVIAYVRTNYAKLMDTNAQGGNDTLTGSFNDDIIIGGAGNDVLTGSAGKDNFVFLANSNSGQDTIADFTLGYDKISFTDLTDTSKLIWNAENSVLSFSGTQNGQTYQNSITIQNASVDLTLDELLNVNAVV